ncbi:MAG: PolC-type DNA polymerase III [Anaeroplasmataceae bacterium]|nr:PolC-type DNA polymerase III [Anaeroplasmataceae bacterium]
MKLEEIIKAEDIISSEFSVEKVTYHKKSKKMVFHIGIEEALQIEQYKALFQCVKNAVGLEAMKIVLEVEYIKENLASLEYKAYLEAILEELGHESPRFVVFSAEECKIEENRLHFTIPCDAAGVEDLIQPILKKFEDYGLHVHIALLRDEKSSVQEELNALQREIEETLAKQKSEAESVQKINEQIQKEKKYVRTQAPSEISLIKDIPNTQYDISVYQNTHGLCNFTIDAYIFGIEIRSFAKTKSSLATIKVTDESDSILVKKWLRTDTEKELYEKDMKEGSRLKISGKAEFDSFAKQVVINATSIEYIGKKEESRITDTAPVKRVELHCHTKMSNLDGLTDAVDYVKTAIEWDWKAMAFTDHNGIYSVPDIAHAIEKYPDFKPIYGVELNYINDEKYFITLDQRDIELRDATYVVFDIETTGLSQTYDEIIEIAAHKVVQGGIVDTFEVFVNPGRPIPEKIVGITHITDDMVKDALGIEEILPKFMKFCEGAILVAHNASFDVGMIYRDIKKYHMGYEMLPVIDTLNLFRAGYGTEVKTFNLKSLSKYFKVKQEQHHRATDDTRVTALCFIQMLSDLFKRNIYNYKDINSIINKEEHWKHLIPTHITILAKNQVGYKNMYKIISDALTKHFFGNAKALKSVIDAHKEGIFLGSACVNGEVFELALNRSIEELEEAIEYYDYIEVQPPTAYRQLFEDMPNGEERVQEIILKIIEAAKRKKKLVVATSDCHYLRPNLKKYRDILIASPQVGGGQHPLANYKEAPDMHLRTTEEMLKEFEFLHSDLAYEIVVENTNKIADQIEKFPAFKKDMFAPRDDEFKDTFLHIPSITEEVKRIVKENMTRLYGENPHLIVQKRIDRELNSIISNGYASVYYISHLMVEKSLSDGYLVGSRGSVGSSLVATMMQITEINPLSPHYRCKKCKFHTFRMRDDEVDEFGLTEVEKPFQAVLRSVDSGYDLPDAVCPVCGEPLTKDGHDIPFETFLGFNGDKVPDIDLNFSGEYQAQAHEYIREVFGPENAFRAGTVGTIAEKNAYGYVKGYCERKGITLRSCEMDRLATYLVGIKRSTGQHPGGIVVVPHYVDIYDVTPVQYPADNTENTWRTTHYDYHSFENNLLKLDVLGHDDPTLIKYFMDYVHKHQEDFPFSDPQDIPIDDKNIYRLFSGTEVIGVREEEVGSKVASYAVPEFGTNFVRQMLVETLPKTFAQLVKISGLSHGTDVWNTNAQDLVAGTTEFGKIEFKDIIGCRDDIMVDLLHYGLEPLAAFQIMEFVRKGKVAKDQQTWAKYKAQMEEKHVPAWYIWSCERIKYMFPKAHATAYVLMALRIAWFKVNAPALFYSAWFSKRAKGHVVQAYLGGKMAIKAAMEEITAKTDKTATDDDKYTALQVALEMASRGIKFLPVDIMKSSATVFEVEDGALRIPFSAVDSLGESIALDIVKKREEKLFTSKKDIQNRTRLSQSLFDLFEVMHSFGNLPEDDPEEAVGLFAFA